MMRALGLMTLALVGHGCGDRDRARSGAGEAVPVHEVKAKGDVPLVSAAYRDAYEAAKKEITADNAEDRLAEIERAIDEGK